MRPVQHMILSITIMLGLFMSCGDAVTVRPFKPVAEGKGIFNAICYGPHREGQQPGGDRPTAMQIREDLELMQPHWRMLRIYSSSEFAESLLRVISENDIDMKVMLGVWIAPEERRGESGEILERFEDAVEANLAEVEAAIRLANAYPDIVKVVSVGNETQISWSAHRSPLDILIGHVRNVRERVGVPVTVADDFNYWNKKESLELSAEIDFITMHAHPMWNGLQLEDAVSWLRDRLADVQAMHPGRQIVIGETGWATSVAEEGEQSRLIKGKPGEAEQKLFYEALLDWAEAAKQTVFFFEAFDENWKGGSDPAEVEKHWGLFRADRNPKAAMSIH